MANFQTSAPHNHIADSSVAILCSFHQAAELWRRTCLRAQRRIAINLFVGDLPRLVAAVDLEKLTVEDCQFMHLFQSA